MGTKNNPGKFDCYENADGDEPMFVLLGRDPMAPLLINLWALLRAVEGEDMAKIAEAFNCGVACERWLFENGKTEFTKQHALEVSQVFLRLALDQLTSVDPGEDGHLINNAMDGLSDARGYLETLRVRLKEKAEEHGS